MPALLPAILALAAVAAAGVVAGTVVVLRRRRCARLRQRFAMAALTGRFEEAEFVAGRWFDATPWTGISRGATWAERLSRLRRRGRRTRTRSQLRPDIRRRSVS